VEKTAMSTTLTIRLDEKLDAELTRLAKASHRTKSDLARDFIRRELALAELRRSRAMLKPYAEQAGYLTDEDFFRDFS
jgi:predicted transcriptional regulator